MARPETISGMVAAPPGEAVALAAPGREPLTYALLRRQVGAVAESLNGLGVGRGDAVAIVLPEGPELAAAFLSVAAAAAAAPLNPALAEEEFEFALSDLGARALVHLAGEETPARAAADQLAIPLIGIAPQAQGPAGLFTIARESAAGPAAAAGPAEADDTALLLHTSGTTSRPKLVPLSHRNLCASARNIVGTLKLTGRDRCLNVMPLFHIHGLAAALLASLRSGGSVFCAPGFNALKFFSLLEEARPTWFTAVPAMHRAILARAPRNREIIGRNPLRFLRSSSAALPPRLLKELEETFAAPVIEAYGMTEAAHQMASNHLPPGRRKPGAVGQAAGPEIAILDDVGGELPAECPGEVAVRGENVMAGYANDPAANAEAFAGGWFRTGDQGVMDGEGFLTITGRLKEIINRGGEKISPLEVDGVLLDHPDVREAVTFAMAHGMLGEEVAAAVVLREGGAATESDLRDFVGRRLAAFKVPRRIVFLDEIPKGATGKTRRAGMAERLGLSG